MRTITLVYIVIAATVLIAVGISYFKSRALGPENRAVEAPQANAQSSLAKAVAPQLPLSVKLSSKPGIGNYLTDRDGLALYYSANDTPGKSNCVGNCASLWPEFHDDNLRVAAGLNAANFGSIAKNSGSLQATYNGWPLYRYSKDIEAGNANGQGSGGIWYAVVDPFYTIVLQNNRISGGVYLADAKGLALYIFANDAPAAAGNLTNNCAEICAQSWPPFYIERSKIIAPGGIVANDFMEFIRTDGKKQLAYKGHPLYYHAQDTAGEVSGNGLNEIWFLARPAAR